MITPKEEQFICDILGYSKNVRRYSHSRTMELNRSMRHIFNQLSIDVVLSELNTATNPDSRKNCIYQALISRNEISSGVRSKNDILRTLDTITDYCRWKKGVAA